MAAARNAQMYRLWWHPHNFGLHLEENFSVLNEILTTFEQLRAEHGFESLTMAEAAAQLGPTTG